MIISLIVAVWTITAIALNQCGVGAFAAWPLVAPPWEWSCFFVLFWDFILLFLLLVLIFVVKMVGVTAYRKSKRRIR